MTHARILFGFPPAGLNVPKYIPDEYTFYLNREIRQCKAKGITYVLSKDGTSPEKVQGNAKLSVVKCPACKFACNNEVYPVFGDSLLVPAFSSHLLLRHRECVEYADLAKLKRAVDDYIERHQLQ